MIPYSLIINYCILEHTMKYSFSHEVRPPGGHVISGCPPWYENTPILTYEICFPQFKTKSKEYKLDYLNDYYHEKARLLESYTEKVLFPQAVSLYRDSIKSNIPFHPYEVKQAFTITYNQCHMLSLYLDQYTFTGGAHGNTVRYSNTWNLASHSIMTLKDFFPFNPQYKQDITAAINTYVAGEKSAGNSDFFDDYTQNISKNFNENNFYLVPDGIVIYFQQYEIAPYSSGIPQFFISFAK